MVASDSEDCFMTIYDGSDIESDDFHGGSSEDAENVIPKKKVLSAPSTNKAAPKKFKKKVPMTAAVQNEHTVAAMGSTTNTIHTDAPKIPQMEETVKERYQKKSQSERILLRPDAYSTFLLSFTPLCFIQLRFNGTFSLNRLK
jgi:hypothetical protein